MKSNRTPISTSKGIYNTRKKNRKNDLNYHRVELYLTYEDKEYIKTLAKEIGYNNISELMENMIDIVRNNK